VNNAVYAQITRGFRASLRSAGVAFRWVSETFEIPFVGIKNPIPPTPPGGIDRNSGDDAACKISALVEDLGGTTAEELPQQGDSFRDAAGQVYQISTVHFVPGHPVISFTISNVVPAL
jgi:hypothetical protein